MKYCHKCGKELDDEVRFCIYCGASVPVKQPRPEAPKPIKTTSSRQSQHTYTKETRSSRHKKKKMKTSGILIIVAIVLAIAAGGGFLVWKMMQPTYTDIDVSSGITVSYTGVNGKGVPVVKNDVNYDTSNEKIKDFVESLHYQCSPDKELSNGDSVEVTVSYDESTAKDLHLNVITSERTFKVEGLDEEKKEENEIKIKEVTASSTLAPQKGYTYNPTNLIDDDLNTCWAEGADGYGEGEYVTVEFEKTCEIVSISLYNGYTKNDEVYSKNSRVNKLTLIFDDGAESIILSDERNVEQTFPLKTHKTKSVKLVIQTVYEGSQWEDTCLSDISFA